jgi:hypothetical protein|tara:strand:- start:430 stop:633 length:204 start_codon:yes stop_codon:yes gene_type:complete
MKDESSTINCQHRSVDQETILEWDTADNHLLQCGCIASPSKLDREKKEIATWIIDDGDCENKDDKYW